MAPSSRFSNASTVRTRSVKRMRPVDQHGDAPGGHTLPHAHGPWHGNGNERAPAITDEVDQLVDPGAIVAVRDQVVSEHRSTEQFHRRVLERS